MLFSTHYGCCFTPIGRKEQEKQEKESFPPHPLIKKKNKKKKKRIPYPAPNARIRAGAREGWDEIVVFWGWKLRACGSHYIDNAEKERAMAGRLSSFYVL